MTYVNLKQQADELQKQAQELQRQATAKLAQANEIRNKCMHKWEAYTYDPIITKGYTVPGDPPGTMGIDHRNAFYVEGTTTPRWKRRCSQCGYEQTTKITKLENGANGLKQEVPKFEYTDRYNA